MGAFTLKNLLRRELENLSSYLFKTRIISEVFSSRNILEERANISAPKFLTSRKLLKFIPLIAMQGILNG